MNRMDCFKKQPSNYHFGNPEFSSEKVYEVVHAETLMALNDEFQSTYKIWYLLGRKYNKQTVATHLKILASEGRAVWRKVETIKEWRRA